MVPGTLIFKMWALGDSSQSKRAVEPDHSVRIGGRFQNKRLRGYPKIVSAIVDYTSVKRNAAEKGKKKKKKPPMNDMVLEIFVMNNETIIYFMCL